ncbi:MAG: hypothetical protein LBG84_01335 [Treponema sp.]|jgi:hypothetical protein|nr:hypothetical protein [Treponema sp.]
MRPGGFRRFPPPLWPLAAALLFFGAAPASLSAQDEGEAGGGRSFFGALEWFLRGSIIVFPEDNGAASAPAPILPSLGGGVSYPCNDLLALELSLDLYGNTYDYDYRLGRAVPANDEFRSTFVIGSVVGFQPVFRFRPRGEQFTIRVYGGLAADLRICLLAYGLEKDEKHTNDRNPGTGHTVGEAAGDAASYFWGRGRWLLPAAGAGMDFPALDGLLLGFDIRVWFPLYRAWTGENLPLVEGFRLGIGFRAAFYKKSPGGTP